MGKSVKTGKFPWSIKGVSVEARDFVSSVFPTPVGPEKMKLAIGRLGFLRPTLALLIALETAFTASS